MESPSAGGYINGTLHDYLGIPTEIPDLEHSALWHRAYNLIFNEWQARYPGRKKGMP